MERALIIGNSGGIGSAMQAALRQQGVAVAGLSRSVDGFDVTSEASVKAHMTALDGRFDLILVATGALEIDGYGPEKSLGHVSAQALADQFALNAMGPILVLKHALPLIARDRPAVFAALSARVGSIGDNRLGGWYSYRASKAALNQLVHGAAIELARSHKQLACVCLHPGTVATEFTAKYQGRHPTVSGEQAAARLIRVIEGLQPKDTGRFLDYAGKQIPW